MIRLARMAQPRLALRQHLARRDALSNTPGREMFAVPAPGGRSLVIGAVLHHQRLSRRARPSERALARNSGEKRVALELHRRFRRHLFDLGVVSLDRATQPLALPRLSAPLGAVHKRGSGGHAGAAGDEHCGVHGRGDADQRPADAVRDIEHIRKPTWPEWIAHRDFTPIEPVPDSALSAIPATLAKRQA
jgi:hypothetical protein